MTKVALETNLGRIVIKILKEAAPKTSENFIDLVRSGFYDGTKFHRIIPGFVIEAGDPTTRIPQLTSFRGNQVASTMPFEYTKKSHLRGIVSMIRDTDLDSASSQFFIVVSNSPFLDGQYSSFGEVVEGMEVVDTITNLSRNEEDIPINGVIIFRAYIVPEVDVDHIMWAAEEIEIPCNESGRGSIDIVMSAQTLSKTNKIISDRSLFFDFLNESKQLAQEENVEILGMSSSLQRAKESFNGHREVRCDKTGKAYLHLRAKIPTRERLKNALDPGPLIGIQVSVKVPNENIVVADNDRDDYWFEKIIGKGMLDAGLATLNELQRKIIGEMNKTDLQRSTELAEAIDESLQPFNMMKQTGEAVIKAKMIEVTDTLRIQKSLVLIPVGLGMLKWAYDKYLQQLTNFLKPRIYREIRKEVIKHFSGDPDKIIKAILGGFSVGIAQGSYNAASASVNDFKFVFHDLPKILHSFIKKRIREPSRIVFQFVTNPVQTSMELIGNATRMLVIHGLDAYNFLKYSFLTKENLFKLKSMVESILKNMNNNDMWNFVKKIGDHIYVGFEKHLQQTSKFLGYKEHSEKNAFINAFIVGDIAGYVSTTIAGQVALHVIVGYLTVGAGNILLALSKLGGFARKSASSILRVIKATKSLLQHLGTMAKFLKEKFRRGGARAKNAIGGFFSVFLKIFLNSTEIIFKLLTMNRVSVKKVFDAVFELVKKALTWIRNKAILSMDKINWRIITQGFLLLVDAGLNELLGKLIDGFQSSNINEGTIMLKNFADDREYILNNYGTINNQMRKKYPDLFSRDHSKEQIYKQYVTAVKMLGN